MCRFKIYLLILIAVIFSFIACSKTYRIGDICPAGGIVFYDKGVKQDGWRYLSAAPANTEFPAVWSVTWHDISRTQVEMGTGKQNTQLIVTDVNSKGQTGTATQMCVALDVNGYSDWFLPSRDELNEMRSLIDGFQDS